MPEAEEVPMVCSERVRETEMRYGVCIMKCIGYDLGLNSREALRAVDAVHDLLGFPPRSAGALQAVVPVGTHIWMRACPFVEALETNNVAAVNESDGAAAISLAVEAVGLAANSAERVGVDIIEELIGVGFCAAARRAESGDNGCHGEVSLCGRIR
jgi:hypothetical protein